MPALGVLPIDLEIQGTLSVLTDVDFPDGSLNTDMFSAATSERLAATKSIARKSLSVELFGPTTTVAALTKGVHIVRGATGTLVGLQATVHGTIATGADRSLTIDLQKSTGAGAFATVLTGVLTIDDEDVVRTVYSATISSTGLVVGDILELIVAVAGASGNQALGLLVTLTFDEAPT